MERINEFLNQYKIPLSLSLVGLVLIIGGLATSGLFKHAAPKTNYPKESLVKWTGSIKVDISGAVKTPGVYEMSNGDRIEDLIKASGGFSASASAEYISKTINLATKLSDGQKVYVPFAGESGGSFAGSVAGVNTSSKIGINSATQVQIESLPGIGAVTAEKIILKRPYSSVEELLTKKVVSKTVYDKIKELVDSN